MKPLNREKKVGVNQNWFFCLVVFVVCSICGSGNLYAQVEHKLPPEVEMFHGTLLERGIDQKLFVPEVSLAAESLKLSLPEPFIEGLAELKVEAREERSEMIVRSPKPRKASSLPQLIQHDDLHGTINSLPYEWMHGWGVRFRYTKISKKLIGHFWWFKGRDLRGKTVRVRYSGLVPAEIVFRPRENPLSKWHCVHVANTSPLHIFD